MVNVRALSFAPIAIAIDFSFNIKLNMSNKNDDSPSYLPLNDDFIENMPIENELLRLKLKAEPGGESYQINEINAEVENAFLKHVFDFEHNYAKLKRIKVFDLWVDHFKKAQN